MRSMLNALGHRNCVLLMWTHYERWYFWKQEIHLIRAGFVLHPELLYKKWPATRSQIRESTWLQRVTHSKSTSKEVSQKEIWQHPRPIHPRQVLPKKKNEDWVGSLRRDHPWSACKRKPQSYCHQSRNWRFPFLATGGFARTWWISIRCQQGINMTFKKTLSTLYRLKKAENKKHSENWSQSSSSWWQWQTNWWEPY